MTRKLSNVAQIAIVLGMTAVIVICLWTEVSFKDAVPLLVALVAGFVALSINETVSSRRKAELAARLREQRERVYRDLIEHLLQSFTEGSRKPETQVRTQIALWGSPDLLKAYTNWQSLSRPIIRQGLRVTVPRDLRQPLQESVAEVCLAAREDLGIAASQDPTIFQIANLFFDDYNENK